MFKREVRGAIWALFFISLGGLLLHLRIHPFWPVQTPEGARGWEFVYLIPAIFGVVTTLILPFMFNSRKTVAWAYLINWLAVIIGTITMAYFALEHIADWRGSVWSVTLVNAIVKTTLADILILWAKVPLGHVILRHFRPKAQ